MRSPENQNHVFFSLIQTFGSVSGNNGRIWIKDLLANAGTNTLIFTAHFARGAAASKRASQGAG